MGLSDKERPMRRKIWLVLAALALAASPAQAGPGRGLGRLREAIQTRLLQDLSPEQKGKLKAIQRAFVTEVRTAHGASLRAAAQTFLGTVKSTLTDDQKAKAKAAAARLRGLPPAQKIALGWKLLGSMDVQALKADLAAWIDAKDAGSGTAASERILRQVAKAVAGRARGALGLDDAQVGALRDAFTKLLDDTRAARVDIHRIGRAKMDEALSVLTPEQKARIETMKEAFLNRLRPAGQ